MRNPRTSRTRLSFVLCLWVLCALCGGAVVVSLCLAADKPAGTTPPPGAGAPAHGDGPKVPGVPAPKATTAPPQTQGAGGATRPVDPNEVANDPDVKLLVKGLNEFGIDLYKQIAKTEKGNIFFSPFSISSALAMTYAGARGKTAEEMAKVLHFPPELLKDDAKRLHTAFGKLIAHVNAEKGPEGKPRGYELVTANALWVQAGHPFLDRFIRTNTDNYKASFDALDFIGDRQGASDKINAWVGKQTRGKIGKIIDESLLHNTRLVLTNAVYFKGAWAQKFDKALTREAEFNLASGQATKVPFMNSKVVAGYLPEQVSGDLPGVPAGCRFQELEMPYVGRDVSFLVILPKEAQGIGAFERALSPGLLAVKIPAITIDTSIPRLAIRFDIDLSGLLRQTGMQACFTPGQADFSGIDSTRDFAISRACHGAIGDVNEEGTEAAAATGGTFAWITAPPAFVADHPFFFVVRNTLNGCILFMGRVMDPTSDKALLDLKGA